MSVLGVIAPADGAWVVRDLLKEWKQARLENLLGESRIVQISSGGVVYQAAFLHPTEQPARATFNLELPVLSSSDQLVLICWGGVDDSIPREDKNHPHDGVRFLLEIEGKRLAEADCSQPGWVPLSADLTPWAGKRITLSFVADGKANTNYDWAYIAQPMVLRVRPKFAQSLRSGSLPPEGVLELSGEGAERWRLKAVGLSLPAIPLGLEGASRSEAGRRTLWLFYSFPGAKGAELSGVPLETIRVYPFAPRLRLKRVGVARALLAPGERTEVVVTIQNIGRGSWRGGDLNLTLTAQQGAQVERISPKGEMILPPGGERSYRFAVRALGSDPVLILKLQSGAGEDMALVRLPVAARPQPIPSSGRWSRTFGSHAVLQNEHLRLVLSSSNVGTAARLYRWAFERWYLVATSCPVAEAILTGAGGVPRRHVFRMTKVQPSGSREKGLSLLVQGSLGPIGRVALEYRLEGQTLSCSAQLSVAQNADLYLFRFPDWRVGDGSFGVSKTEALLPGLEYLLGEEPSSDTQFAAPPFHQRFAPHPYKVTIPLMAVRKDKLLFVLSWDPLQNWSGSIRYPNVLFFSPAPSPGVPSLYEGAHHRLALWVPSMLRWADENSLQAREPFRLLANETVQLKAQVHVQAASQAITDALEWYLAQRGVPRPPAPERNLERALELTLSGLLGAWDESQKAWRHTNTGPVFYDPMVALPLWVLAHRMPESDPRRMRALQQVKEAVQRVAKAGIGLELGFYLGGLPTLLRSWQAENEQRMRTQRADGSWAWQPDSERHRLLGQPGDTSSGHSGREASILWRYALLTLDPKALQAAEKALRYLATQWRPEGAQTWELPLHVPDILAAAYCVQAYLDAYEYTGESRFLQRARYWALTGLPFVYLWNAHDRPLMRGATIPVFGVTWLNTQPWFGVAVQWCGLVYARALLRLAPLDRSLDWGTLAALITLCGVQQQELITNRYPADEGMYPDAYSLVKGDEEYHWDLNPRLVAPNLSALLGFEIEPRIMIVKGAKETPQTPLIAVAAPGLKSASWQAGKLQIELNLPFRLPAVYAMVSGLEKPGEVRVGFPPAPPAQPEEEIAPLPSQSLPTVEDMDAYLWTLGEPRSGWWYHPKNRWLIVRIVDPGLRTTLEILD